MKAKPIILAISIIFLMSASALAEVPDEISFMGRLVKSGQPVTTTTTVTFQLYENATGGSSVWSETQGVTPNSQGVYIAYLGTALNPIPTDYDSLWLQVIVEGTMLTPRRKFTSVPYALRAGQSDSAPGTVVQTVVRTSVATTSLNVTSFTEAHTDYRVSIIPKFANSKILVEYNFSINTDMATNTVFHMQLVRNIAGSETLVGVGPPNGVRQRTSYVSRPNNGYDINDLQNVYMVAQDTGLAAGTTYTYGFKYRREAGGSGTCYFNYSRGDHSAYGFSGGMTIRITEIAQ